MEEAIEKLDFNNLKKSKVIKVTFNGVDHAMTPKSDHDALLSAGEALLDWARRELMWQPIDTAPRDGWIEAWCSEAEAGLPVFMYPRYVIGSTITHWRPASTPLPPGKLPDPLETFAEAIKQVSGE